MPSEFRGGVWTHPKPPPSVRHWLGGSLPHSQESTTCPYPSQINPFLCPSHFWQTQLVSFLVGLRTYQHPGKVTISHEWLIMQGIVKGKVKLPLYTYVGIMPLKVLHGGNGIKPLPHPHLLDTRWRWAESSGLACLPLVPNLLDRAAKPMAHGIHCCPNCFCSICLTSLSVSILWRIFVCVYIYIYIYTHTQRYSKWLSGFSQLVIHNTPHSPDATLCDFFLWGYVKDQVYVPPLPTSIPELKVVTCYKQFGTNSIIVLMFVESQTVHI